jgi:MoaA/NifB/PqqE/SkfB family radical SAM enzyme
MYEAHRVALFLRKTTRTFAMTAALPAKFKRIHLEITNRCNFSCVFCPDSLMTRKRGDMDEDLAKSALDQIADLDLAEKTTLHVMGEPLLHPRLFNILDHAASRGVAIGLTTNGALLTSSVIRALAERDLHQIDISLQTPDEASFHATRGTRMNFDKYRRGLLDLLAECRGRPSAPIFKIRVMTTRFAGNMRQVLGIPNFLGTGPALRSTILEWARLIYERLDLDPAALEKLPKLVNKIGVFAWNVIEISPKIFIETYVLTDWGNAFADGEVIEAGHGHCFGMRDHFAILWSGDVVLCCIDFDGCTSFGNIKESSLAEILKSPDLERIVSGFAKGKLIHPHCRRCLGSKTKLSSWTKPALSILGLKALKPLFYRHYKLYKG